MPTDLTTLLSAQNALDSYLFWLLLLALAACIVFPERVHAAQALRRGFIAFLTIIGTKAFAALFYGLFALFISNDFSTREIQESSFAFFGISSFAAAASWAALAYGFWQVFVATSAKQAAAASARPRRSKRRRSKHSVSIIKPITDEG